MGVKLLCTGDVHLGRRPRRVPDHLGRAPPGPAAVWAATVHHAVERDVDAVVLTGDVVDEENKFYEAYASLARGVRRLVEAGIAVYAVAGNHDFDVLARLADEIGDFHLLGRGGKWHETSLQRDGRTVLRLIGWSFPSRTVRTSPLSPGVPPARSGIPTVGLLHCDCDAAPDSPYAPVMRRQLADAPVEAWLLGHIHKPQVISEAGPLILYPGSPQGLNPNETGPHGPWVVEIEPGRPPTLSQMPLALLRWEHLDVPLDDLAEGQAFGRTITAALKGLHERIRDELDSVRAVGCRLQLIGRTAVHRQVARLIGEIPQDFAVPLDGVDYFIDRITDASRPDISLSDRAEADDPAGLLARRLALLDSQTPADQYHDLIRRAKRSITSSQAMRDFASVAGDITQVGDKEVAEMLMATGLAILESLLDQEGARR